MRGAHPGAPPALRVSSGFDERAGRDELTGGRDSCMLPEMTLPVFASRRRPVFLGWENISRHTFLVFDQSFEIAEVFFDSARQTWGIEN